MTTRRRQAAPTLNLHLLTVTDSVEVLKKLSRGLVAKPKAAGRQTGAAPVRVPLARRMAHGAIEKTA